MTRGARNMNEKAMIEEKHDYRLCHKCKYRLYKKNRTPEELNVYRKRVGEVCSICGDLLLHEEQILSLVREKIRKLGIEFETFTAACQVNDREVLEVERRIKALTGIKSKDDIRKQVKRDVGVLIAKKLDKRIEFKNPDVIILIKINKKKGGYDYELDNVSIFIDSHPIFIEGRYRKLVRGIPQTKWPCRNCKGRGCTKCDGTGKQYPTSVEELIANPILKMAKADDEKFHGSGREDIDVLMLGTGRPFVVEVKHPHKRNINLRLLRRLINSHSNGMVEVEDLKFTDKSRIQEIKNSSTESYKVYKATAQFNREVTSQDIEKIQNMKTIQQRTPQRVEHRRADMIRERTINHITAKQLNPRKLELTIKCQGGLYIKELISGDNGRTQLSMASITNKKAQCVQLDVIEVHIPD